MAGGCTLLAVSLDEALKTRGLRTVLFNVASDGAATDHTVLKVGHLYIDADGAQTERELLTKMTTVEMRKNPHLTPFSLPAAIKAGHTYSAVKRAALEKALEKRIAGGGRVSGHVAGQRRKQRNRLPIDAHDRALALAVQRALKVEDLTPAYRQQHAAGCDAMTGHCFVATNAFWHATGGLAGKYTPRQVRVEGESHWFLVDDQGRVVDLTASQFSTPVPYAQGRRVGMRARPGGDVRPTERAQAVLDRIAR